MSSNKHFPSARPSKSHNWSQFQMQQPGRWIHPSHTTFRYMMTRLLKLDRCLKVVCRKNSGTNFASRPNSPLPMTVTFSVSWKLHVTLCWGKFHPVHDSSHKVSRGINSFKNRKMTNLWKRSRNRRRYSKLMTLTFSRSTTSTNSEWQNKKRSQVRNWYKIWHR
jgi:hypothetical protein